MLFSGPSRGSKTPPLASKAVVTSASPDFAEALSGVRGIQSVVPDLPVELPDATAGDGNLSHADLASAAFFDDLTWGIDAVGAPAAWAAPTSR